jgi:hypothetical protein
MFSCLPGGSNRIRGALLSALVGLTYVAGCSDNGVSPTTPTDDSSVPVPRDAAKDAEIVDAGSFFAPMDAGFRAFEPLIDNLRWRRYDAAVDPLSSHQPLILDCRESATFVEYGNFEIDTTRCNYVLSEHPAQRTVPAGSAVQFELLHYDLTAPAPAQAHLALLFGDTLQWETYLPIPSPGDVVKANFQATRALAIDEPIRLHLHNHGGNAYLVVSLEAAVTP